MKFIKELIQRKNQTASDDDDSDLLAKSADDLGSVEEPDVVEDFSDLVANILKSTAEEVALDPEQEPEGGLEEPDLMIDEANEVSEGSELADTPARPNPDAHDGHEAPGDIDISEDVEPALATTPPLVNEAPVVTMQDDIPAARPPEAAPVSQKTENVAPVRKIWDQEIEDPEIETTEHLRAPETPKQATPMIEVPAPAAGRAGRRAGRVKTRLLGFERSQGGSVDLFEAPDNVSNEPVGKFPVGWIVVTKGPGFGSAFTLINGVSQIGRGEEQAIRLDFGDNSISRNNHAAIAYDNEQSAFFLGHGGKANLVRLNDKPVLSTEQISNGDLIRIGETTLRFVALCSEDFDWDMEDLDDSDDAAIA